MQSHPSANSEKATALIKRVSVHADGFETSYLNLPLDMFVVSLLHVYTAMAEK